MEVKIMANEMTKAENNLQPSVLDPVSYTHLTLPTN